MIEKTKTASQEISENKQKNKKYKSPCLEQLGDLRTITLGPTPGTGESGNPLIFKA